MSGESGPASTKPWKYVKASLSLDSTKYSQARSRCGFTSPNRFMADVSSELTEIFRTVFENERLVVSRESTAADVPGWDSLMHVMLILGIERAFAIRFSIAEVSMLKSAGELEDLIASHQLRR